MKVKLFALLLLISAHFAIAQEVYTVTAGESVFSLSQLDAGDYDVQPVLRWSPFFNYQQQLHIDFTNGVGLYSGLGVRNVGFINNITVDHIEYTIKERSYSLGLPLVFVFGNLSKKKYIGIGAEGEMIFAWKRKICYGDNVKQKNSEWFSDQVNLFNPSVLLEFKFVKSNYIRLKYYLLDFLQYKDGLLLPLNGSVIMDYAKSSKLFYISFGGTFLKQEIGESHPRSTTTTDAYFESVGGTIP